MMRPGARKLALTGFVLATVAAMTWFVAQLLRNPVDDVVIPDDPSIVQTQARATTQVGGRSTSATARRERIDTRNSQEHYAGSNSCAECHSEISRSYQTHPMSHSMARVLDAGPLEDYQDQTTFRLPKSVNYDSEFEYQVIRSEDGVVHRELILDGAGEQIAESSMDIEFSVGSGKRGRSYLVNHDGLLYMSPVTWYSGESRWDLSPAYSRDNQHFERRIIDGCVACHAGRTATVEGRADFYEKKPFHELVIGCERCHGAAAEHVNLHRHGEVPSTTIPS